MKKSITPLLAFAANAITVDNRGDDQFVESPIQTYTEFGKGTC
jgi:hypothetical protein